MRLQNKFILSVALGVVIPAIVISGFNYFTIKSNIVEIEGRRLESLSDLALNTFLDQLDNKKNELKVFSSIDTIRSSLEYEIYDQAHDMLSSFTGAYEGYDQVSLIYRDGKVVSSSRAENIGKALPYDEIPMGTAVFSNPYTAQDDTRYFINITTPVYSGAKQLGTIMATYDLVHLFDKLDAIQVSDENMPEKGHAMIFDATGKVLYTPKFEREKTGNIFALNMLQYEMDAVDKALAGEHGFTVERNEHGIESVTGYARVDRTLSLAAISMNATSAPLSKVYSLMGGIAVFILLFIVVGVMLAIAVARGFIKPLSNVGLRLKDIAEGEGDLTVRLESTTSDEIGELSRWFNAFAERIHGLVQRIAETSGSIKVSSKDVTVLTEKVNTGARNQANRVSEAATAVTEMSSSVVDVAENALTAATSAKEVKQKVEEGNHTVEMTSVGMSRIATQVKATSQEMDGLGQRVSDIGRIVSVIDDIADQTNLLALNAAIEAARAGEHGRGFAVVADEVRKLAERTTSSTKEITQMITNIQSETENSVSGMKSVVKEVNDGLALMEKSRDALATIVGASEKGAEMADMIATAAEQQSATTEEISQGLESVNVVSKETVTVSEGMHRASEKLNVLAEELDSIVNIFKIAR